MNKIKLMEILPRIPLFKDLSPAEREVVLKMAKNIKRIKAEKTFIKEGAHEPFFYIILAGKADVYHRGKLIGELVPGQFIGEVGFICKEPRSATVTAQNDLAVMLIRSEDFRKLPTRIRESIKDKIISGLVERVTGMNTNTIRYEEKIDELEVKVRDYEDDPRMTSKDMQKASVFEGKGEEGLELDTDLSEKLNKSTNKDRTQRERNKR